MGHSFSLTVPHRQEVLKRPGTSFVLDDPTGWHQLSKSGCHQLQENKNPDARSTHYRWPSRFANQKKMQGHTLRCLFPRLWYQEHRFFEVTGSLDTGVMK
jgi:hypothetical protein